MVNLLGSSVDFKAQIRQQRSEIEDLTARLRLTVDELQACKKRLKQCKGEKL